MIIRVITHDAETGDRKYEDYDSYGDLAYRLDDYEAGDLIENLYRYKPYLFKEILGDCSEKA
jgi:hypothetical protein